MHKTFSKNLFIGKKVIYLPKCHSTNSVAIQLVSSDHANEGTLVLTDEQQAGRGQRGNGWESEAGKNITMSVMLRPVFLKPMQQFHLTMVVSLAVKKTLDDCGLTEVKVKWPNDVYVGNGKIAGILIENALRGNIIESSVVGIGLNVNQERFQTERATSVKVETGSEANTGEVLSALTGNLEALYLQLKAGNSRAIQARYLDGLLGWNEDRWFKDNEGRFEGRILGVSEQGRLRLEKNGLLKEYDLKEIEFTL